MLVTELTAHFLHIGVLRQRRVVIFAQPAWIEVNHLLELRQLVLHFDDLVDLFLIAHHRKPCAAVIHDIGHLFGIGVLIQRNRHRANHLGGDH